MEFGLTLTIIHVVRLCFSYFFLFPFFAVSAENIDKDIISMETMMSEEEKSVLEQVKGTFPCWQSKQLKKKIMRSTNWRFAKDKSVLIVLFILIASFVVGKFIRQTKYISIWWHNSFGHVNILYSLSIKQDKNC